MKLKHNRAPSPYRKPLRALAAVSALAIAASGSGAPKASANTDRNPDTIPQQALTGVIARLQAGKAVEVTAKSVGVLGSAGDAAKAQPIEFLAGGKAYFAYSQEHEPDFKATPGEVASTMSIVEVQLPSDNGTAIALTKAHLNKENVLVEVKNHNLVGYSTDGDL